MNHAHVHIYIINVHGTFTGIAAGPRKEFWSCFSQEVLKKDHHLFQKRDNSYYTYVKYLYKTDYTYMHIYESFVIIGLFHIIF